MRVLGLDPGLSGAVGVVNTKTRLAVAHDMPLTPHGKARIVDAAILSSLVDDLDPQFAIIEQVASRPRQGISTTGKMMMAYGTAYGVVAGKGLYVHHVVPVKWKRDLGLLGKDKEASRQLALKLFPEAAPYLKRKKDHGRAEALLLAHWGVLNAARLGVVIVSRRSLLPA